MATSTIYDTVKISDPNVAEAFISAIEESERQPRPAIHSMYTSRMATRDDTIRLHEMRKKRRTVAE